MTRFRLVPARIKEKEFWSQYFEQLVVSVSTHVQGGVRAEEEEQLEEEEEGLP